MLELAEIEATNEEKREARAAALEKLPEDQRKVIEQCADKLIQKVKAKNKNLQFSRDAAYELFSLMGLVL